MNGRTAIGQKIEDELISIVQDPKMVQFGGRGLQINVLQVGDSAIREAKKVPPNVRAAVEYLLEALPNPRLKLIRFLAIAVAYEKTGSWTKAAQELGLNRCAWWGSGSIERRNAVTKYLETGELPNE